MQTANPTRFFSLPFEGEAFVSGSTGLAPVTIDQFPAVIVKAVVLPSAARRRAAYIVA